MRLASQIVTVDQLTANQQSTMLDLMQRHYSHVQPQQFFADLEEKHWAILLYEPSSSRLCGFSTQALVTFDNHGTPATAIFSGDTIVDRPHWGDPELGHAWGQLALRLIDESHETPLDWFLISQGFRTYRYLSLFFREFYPRFDRPTPSEVSSRIATVAKQLFGPRYDSASNVIRADATSYRLRPELANAADRKHDPHIAFFLRQNPGHVFGEELCCIAPLTRDNFTNAAWRVIDRQKVADLR